MDKVVVCIQQQWYCYQITTPILEEHYYIICPLQWGATSYDAIICMVYTIYVY